VEKEYYDSIALFRKKFEEAMDDDFNTPEAIASIFEFVKDSNRYFMKCNRPNKNLCRYALETLLELGKVLTLFQEKKEDNEKDIEKLVEVVKKHGGKAKEKNLDGLMDEILKIRQAARKEKNWSKADAIRDELAELGFEIQDAGNETKWRRK